MLIGNSLPMGSAGLLGRVVRSNCDIFCTEFFLLLPGGYIPDLTGFLDLKDVRMLGGLSIHQVNPFSEYPVFITEFHLLPQLCLVSLSAAMVEDELGWGRDSERLSIPFIYLLF